VFGEGGDGAAGLLGLADRPHVGGDQRGDAVEQAAFAAEVGRGDQGPGGAVEVQYVRDVEVGVVDVALAA
jgi:hypothetical protein